MQYLKLDVITPVPAPYFIGSAVRGALGHGLKNIVCINPQKICEGCFAAQGCLYYELYEQKRSYHELVLRFSLDPGSYRFSITLLNSLANRYVYFVRALHEVFRYLGVGPGRLKSDKMSIEAFGNVIYENGEFNSVPIEPKTFHYDEFCPNVEVEFVTPLRIKRDGKIIGPQNFLPEDLLRSLVRKRSFYENRWIDAPKLDVEWEKELCFVDVMRYSSRQKTKMKLGGVMGKVWIRGLDSTGYELLKFGELVGAGKLATFGLGQIKVTKE